MKKTATVLFCLLALGNSAFADGISNPVAATCANAADCSVSGVSLTASFTSSISGRSANLQLLGAGLRKKKVAIVNVNVYVGQVYAVDPTQFVRTSDGALASLGQESAVAVSMTFVRDVSADQVQGAFQDALAANNVDQTTTQEAAFLAAVEAAGSVKSGTVVTTIGERLADGSEVVTYITGTQAPVSVAGPAGFVNDTMSIWLGTPSDTDLGNAKNDMMIDRKLTN